MLRFPRSFRRWLSVGLVAVSFSVLLTVLTDRWITRESSARLYQGLEAVPYHKVAIVLGCSEYLRDGRLNLYFLHRINAAAELYHAGKCDFLIVSGDNSRFSYNEPRAMRQALVHRGVPEDCIISDFAGFRTLDSVVRARKVFQQREAIIVSQPFHNERALFIAKRQGLEAVAYNADSVGTVGHLKTGLREKLARVKTAIDLYVTKAEPRFLGAPIPIP